MMMGVNHACVKWCSLMLAVMASMYPISVGCDLIKKCSSLTIFLSVFSVGRVACRVVWIVGG